jgi:hypothetical protein
MIPGTHAAGTRAAHAALDTAPGSGHGSEFDRYLLVEDVDDDTTEIRTILRERFPRGLEVPS